MIDYDAVWQQLENNAGRTFTTTRGLKFTYSVIGHEMKISRKEKSITFSAPPICILSCWIWGLSMCRTKAPGKPRGSQRWLAARMLRTRRHRPAGEMTCVRRHRPAEEMACVRRR